MHDFEHRGAVAVVACQDFGACALMHSHSGASMHFPQTLTEGASRPTITWKVRETSSAPLRLGCYVGPATRDRPRILFADGTLCDGEVSLMTALAAAAQRAPAAFMARRWPPRQVVRPSLTLPCWRNDERSRPESWRPPGCARIRRAGAEEPRPARE